MLIKYIGSTSFQEFPYTGTNALWQPNQQSDISDARANILKVLPNFYAFDGINWVSKAAIKNAMLSNGFEAQLFPNGVSDITVSSPGAGTVVTSNLNGGVTVTQNSGHSIVTQLTFNVAPFILEATSVVTVIATINRPLGLDSINTYVTTQASNFVGYLNIAGNIPANTETPFSGGKIAISVTGTELDATPRGDGSIRIGANIDRMKLLFIMSEGTVCTINGIYISPACTAATSIIFDDCDASAYSYGVNALAQYGYKGTFAVNSSSIGTVNKMTLQNLKDIYAAGWDLVNHLSDHVGLLTGYGASFGVVDGPLNHICSAQTITAGNNFVLDGTIGSATFDEPRHLCFKSAGADVTKRFYVTGIDEYGRTKTEIVIGRSIAAYIGGESAWKKIISINAPDGTASTVSIGVSYSYNEAYVKIKGCKDFLTSNGFTRGSNIYVSPNGQITPLVVRALNDLGYTIHRGIRTNHMQPFLAPTPMGMPCIGGQMAAGDSATMIGYLDKVVARWSPILFYQHKIVADSVTPGASEAKIGDFKAFLAAVYAYSSANKIKVLTLSEFTEFMGY